MVGKGNLTVSAPLKLTSGQLTIPLRRPWKEVRANFYRRWKWAFVPDFDAIDTMLVCGPEYDKFMLYCKEVVQPAPVPSDEEPTPSDGPLQPADDGPGPLFRAARDAFVDLAEKHLTSSGGLWAQDQRRVSALAELCALSLTGCYRWCRLQQKLASVYPKPLL